MIDFHLSHLAVMDTPEHLGNCVRAMASSIRGANPNCACLVKIRCFEDVSRTVSLAKMLVRAGCHCLTGVAYPPPSPALSFLRHGLCTGDAPLHLATPPIPNHHISRGHTHSFGKYSPEVWPAEEFCPPPDLCARGGLQCTGAPDTKGGVSEPGSGLQTLSGSGRSRKHSPYPSYPMATSGVTRTCLKACGLLVATA